MGKKGKRRLMDGSHRFRVDLSQLPPLFPTHLHSPEFWESLGRTVATFGFLESVLFNAITALTGTRPYEEGQEEAARANWKKASLNALTGALGTLIVDYEKALRAHPEAKVEKLEELLDDLRAAATLRNVLCHAMWNPPDGEGRSWPSFVDRKLKMVVDLYDAAVLDHQQRAVAFLAAGVLDSFAFLGEQPTSPDGYEIPAPDIKSH